jgi:hypothetical protein
MSYATVDDLRDWLWDEPPNDADRQLSNASRVIDSALFGAIYTTDPTTHLPTDALIIAALRDATCAQVEWWLETGDELEQYGAYHKIDNLDAGVNLQREPGKRSPLADRAYEILHIAGLLPPTIILGWGPHG